MKKLWVPVMLMALVATGCKRSQKQLLTGTWRSTKLENPDIDSFFAKSKMYIDTIGSSNDPAVNMELYGTNNIDSLRREMRSQYDSARNLQAQQVTNTVFTFKDNNRMFISFNGVMDTCKWTLPKENAIKLEDLNAGAHGETMTWDIVSLTDKELVLKMEENKSISKVTFVKEEK